MLSTANHPTDADLIESAQNGDTSAFGVLVRRYQHSAIRIAAMTLGSATDADDVAQEAFVKAHKALPRFRSGGSFQPWLFQIVVNTARTRQRRMGRQRAVAERKANLEVTVDSDPAELVAAHDESRRMISAINSLRPDDRLILTYRWYDQLSESEIAEALGCRTGTVKSRLSRAMSRLRQELEET